MNRSNLIVVAILLLAIAVLFTNGTATVKTARALDDLIILNDTGYLDAFGYYLVLGELENSGSQAVEQWEVNASFYNATGGLLCTRAFNTTTSSSMLDTINPGRKSPFLIAITNETLSSEVDHYTVTVSSYQLVPAKPLGLQILGDSSRIDAFGNMIVNGTIKNVGTMTASSVNIIATFYNESGKVVAVSDCYTEPLNIGPGTTTSFQIELASVGPYPIDNIVSYVLEAESLEYAMVPELSSLLILSALMTLTFLAIALTKRMNVHT